MPGTGRFKLLTSALRLIMFSWLSPFRSLTLALTLLYISPWQASQPTPFVPMGTRSNPYCSREQFISCHSQVLSKTCQILAWMVLCKTHVRCSATFKDSCKIQTILCDCAYLSPTSQEISPVEVKSRSTLLAPFSYGESISY